MNARTIKVDRSPFKHYIEYGEGDDFKIIPVSRMANLSTSLTSLRKKGVQHVRVKINTALSAELCHTPFIVYEGHPQDVREHLKRPWRGM